MTSDDSGAAQAIANLLATYAERVDAGDFAGVGELFSDATFRSVISGGVATLTGASEVAETMKALVRTYDGSPRTRHVTTNLIVDVDVDTASCRSYFTVLQQRPGIGLGPIIAGRYHDRFASVDGRWCFRDRLVFTDLVGDISQHLRSDPFTL